MLVPRNAGKDVPSNTAALFGVLGVKLKWLRKDARCLLHTALVPLHYYAVVATIIAECRNSWERVVVAKIEARLCVD